MTQQELIAALEEERRNPDVVARQRHEMDQGRRSGGNPDIAAMLAGILARLEVQPNREPYEGPCGLPSWDHPRALAGQLYCDNGHHYRDEVGDGASMKLINIGRCPMAIAGEIRARVDAEARRRGWRQLAPYHATDCPAGYDVTRCKGGARALAAMQVLAAGRPPAARVLLSGQTGLGKSHLLIAAHLELVAAGIPCEYATAEELRPVFRALNAYDAEIAGGAAAHVERLARAPVLLLDELARVNGSAALHADFAAGLLRLLDLRVQLNPHGARAAALNLGRAEAAAHPDIGDVVLSRLCEGAEIVRLEGDDQRIATATRRETDGRTR